MNTDKTTTTASVQPENVRVINKRFKRLQDAERFQSILYGKFDYVRLVDFPRFSQDGAYTWNVKE